MKSIFILLKLSFVFGAPAKSLIPGSDTSNLKESMIDGPVIRNIIYWLTKLLMIYVVCETINRCFKITKKKNLR